MSQNAYFLYLFIVQSTKVEPFTEGSSVIELHQLFKFCVFHIFKKFTLNICLYYYKRVFVSFSMCVLLTSPDDRTLFMYSRKDSSFISLSVKMKLMPLPCWPAVLYKPFRSSIRLAVLYDLEGNRMHKINVHLRVEKCESGRLMGGIYRMKTWVRNWMH